jgi:uncharacterized protein (UPF0276 family)
MNVPELGVGMVYFPGLEEVFQADPDVLSVVEIEPQTFWMRTMSGPAPFRPDPGAVEFIRQLRKPVIFHGVGFPVGGRLDQGDAHLHCLAEMSSALHPQWMSEHLSFNTIRLRGRPANTNFLLPPAQTPESVAIAARAIEQYQHHLDLPFAIETGVNYLAPQPWELSDGEFVNAVAEASNAHILLDIHNILTNARNGRQNVADFMARIDTSNVLEVHLAGGFAYNGFYLDAHSGPADAEILDIARRVIRQLPNLKAIIFEMLPDYYPQIGLQQLIGHFRQLQALWEVRGRDQRLHPEPATSVAAPESAPPVAEWEQTLGRLALNPDETISSPLASSLRKDPGLSVIHDLITRFRLSAASGSARLTCRYLLLRYGEPFFHEYLRGFWAVSTPRLFAAETGLDLIEYLMAHPPESDAGLDSVLAYEHATLKSMLEQRIIQVELGYHPEEMVRNLSDRTLFDDLVPGNYLVSIFPGELTDHKMTSVHHS